MKTLIIISSLIIGHCSFGQQTEDKFNVDHGVSLKCADSSEKENIYILKFDTSKAVVFPATYAKNLFGHSDQYKEATFFKPDSNLVKVALTELENQYCTSLLMFRKRTWQNTIDIHKEDGLRKELRKIKKQQKKQLKLHNKFCPLQREQLNFKDKQVIAFYRPSGDTLLYIQILDFRQDPYKLQPHFMTSWINGWHGWFETNTMRFHFHADKKLLTINEDL